MNIVQGIVALRETVRGWRNAGARVGFVPTMGSLHDGHMSLLEAARQHADRVIASVFVNPLQFGPNEDFDRYPRTLETDRALLARHGVQVLFAPSVPELFPAGNPPTTTVRVGGSLAGILCAPFRPGHFDGVATVVNVLFNRVAPQVAVFGEKDYQQLAVIRQMTADLGLPVRIVGVPTLREADGLAMSSRNQYLSTEERARAPRLHEALVWVGQQLAAGRSDHETLSREGQARLVKGGFNSQYLEIRTTDLAPPGASTRVFVVLAAAFLGATRLIDNITVTLE